MFESREQAGQLLVDRLLQYKNRADVIVLGIPRGGVVVAKVVAKTLGAPFDIVIVKKIGAPDNPELAIGAVGEKDVVFWDEDLCKSLQVDKAQRLKLKKQKLGELKERVKVLRTNRKMVGIEGKIIILVDDGVATGATVIAAAKFIKKLKAGKIILATPVIAKDTLGNIKIYFDEVIFIDSPSNFYAVGEFYKEFPQVSDNEVVEILRD